MSLQNKILKSSSMFFPFSSKVWAIVVTSTQNHWIIPIKTSSKYYFYHYFLISCVNNTTSDANFGNNIDLRKIDFLSGEKLSESSGFVNKLTLVRQIIAQLRTDVK